MVREIKISVIWEGGTDSVVLWEDGTGFVVSLGHMVATVIDNDGKPPTVVFNVSRLNYDLAARLLAEPNNEVRGLQDTIRKLVKDYIANPIMPPKDKASGIALICSE